MNRIENIFKMPFVLKIIVLCGILAPLIILIAVLNCQVVAAVECAKLYGNAGNLVELLLVVGASFPVLLASYFIIIKNSKAPFFWLISWLLICVSPMILSSVRNNLLNTEQIWFSIGTNIFIGIIVTGYLLMNKDVKNYLKAG